jgi:hypothetical protein
MCSSILSLTSTLDRDVCLRSRPGRFPSWKDNMYLFYKWLGGRTGAEYLPFKGIRSPDHSARIKSLYRISALTISLHKFFENYNKMGN